MSSPTFFICVLFDESSDRHGVIAHCGSDLHFPQCLLMLSIVSSVRCPSAYPLWESVFYTAKETIDKMKRQPTEWEKIFANDMTGKGLIPKTYEQLI